MGNYRKNRIRKIMENGFLYALVYRNRSDQEIVGK